MKLKFSKFIIIPIIIAVLATILQVLNQALMSTGLFVRTDGFTWIAFQAWAVYFLAGCTLKGGIRGFIGYFWGITASILIMYLAGWLESVGVSNFWGTPLAIFIVVIPVICFERVPWCDLVPSLFIGSGAYFALATYVLPGYAASGTPTLCNHITLGFNELIFCFIGMFFGWITIVLRNAWEKSCAKA